jgi:hypothetical protein
MAVTRTDLNGGGGRKPDVAGVGGAKPAGTKPSRSRASRFLNPLMRTMVRLLLKRMQERLLLLTFTGRKSRRTFTVPLSYTRDVDGSLLIPGGGAWAPVRLRLSDLP